MTEQRKHDPRTWIGVLFIGGYYAVTITLIFIDTPEKNGNLLNNMMLQLGPPVGMIIGALFRTDRTDEKRAENTGKVMDAMAEQARATQAAAAVGAIPDTGAIRAGDTVTLEEPKT